MGSCMSNDTGAASSTGATSNGGAGATSKKKKSAKDERAFQIDQDTLSNFLKQKENLDHVWAQMDKDDSGYLDQQEFQRLLRVSLAYFCELRDPSMPRPDDDTMVPFVEKLSAELSPHIDENGDGRITREEFERFGIYLCQEHQKLQNELETPQHGRN